MCNEDIRVKLESWGITDADADKIIISLTAENFINENRYANAFVKDKYHYNRWGRVKIASHLRAKKIGTESIRSALALIDENQYKQMIKDTLSGTPEISQSQKPVRPEREVDEVRIIKGI